MATVKKNIILLILGQLLFWGSLWIGSYFHQPFIGRDATWYAFPQFITFVIFAVCGIVLSLIYGFKISEIALSKSGKDGQP